MDVDRVHSTHISEEAWIAKYRAALDVAPEPQPRLLNVKAALNTVRQIVRSSFDRLLTNTVRPLPLFKGAERLAPRVTRQELRPSSTEVRLPKTTRSVTHPAKTPDEHSRMSPSDRGAPAA